MVTGYDALSWNRGCMGLVMNDPMVTSDLSDHCGTGVVAYLVFSLASLLHRGLVVMTFQEFSGKSITRVILSPLFQLRFITSNLHKTSKRSEIIG